jgi:hypothetical protein
VHLVRYDLETDAAPDRVVQPHGDGTSAGVEVTGAQRSHHFCAGVKRRQFERESLSAEITFGIGDKKGGIAAGADNADAYGLGPSPIHDNPCGQRQHHAAKQL